MKKGAVVLAALIMLLAVLLLVQRFDMGPCDVKYELLTPDGWSLDFAGPAFAPGTADSLVGHEGLGLPPVEHITQEIYQMPGALMQDVVVGPRVVTITVTTHGITRVHMHAARAKLLDSMRWNRGARAEPSILRYTVNGVSRDLHVYYSGDVRRSCGRYGQMEIIGFRLLAVDPMFYSPETQEQVLDWQDSHTMRSIAAKLDGVWDPLGPPAAVGGQRDVNSIVRDPETGNIIVGGWFTGWDGLPGVTGDMVVQYNVTTNTWQAIGGGLNGNVRRLYVGPNETIFAVGHFTNGSGGAGDGAADYIAQYDRATNTWVNVGGGPGALTLPLAEDMVIGHDGTLYLSGWFTDWDGIPAADYIVSLPLPYAAGGWAAIDTPDAAVYCVEVGLDGHIFAGGDFANIGAVAARRLAEYDPVAATWSPLGEGVNSAANDLIMAPDGLLYLGGSFTLLGVGPDVLRYIASWNGVAFTELGGGTNGNVHRMALDGEGSLYIVGNFTQVGSFTVPDSVARWNGFSWTHLDIDIPGAGGGTGIAIIDGDLWLGFDSAAGTGLVSGVATPTNTGNVKSFPIIEIKNQGLLQTIKNETTGHELLFNLQILDGEIVTIDLGPGIKTVTSTWRGNLLGSVLGNSDLTGFSLESGPRAHYGGVQGANLITVFVTDADARESGDGGNQLSGWDAITGISQDNTDLGKLFVSIVFDGGVNYHVDLFMDVARGAGDLVGHTASYGAGGPQAIVADNNSGLGGTVTIDAVVGVDVDIEVWFTIATIFWRDRWLDVDAAVID